MKTSFPAIVATLILASASATPTSAAPGWSGLPQAAFPASGGVNIHYRPIPDERVQQFAAMGFGAVRMDFTWANVEKQPGVYDFSVYDKLTAQLEGMGARPLYILDYGNPLYDADAKTSAEIKGPPAPPRTDAARAAFAKFAGAAAAHFKGRGILWELWNEPDGNQFWKPAANADEYAAALIPAAKAVRDADPSAVIMGPGLGGNNAGFFKTVFKHGLLKYVDAVSWHPYRRGIPETCASDYLKVRTLIAQFTPAGDTVKPILASEWGYSSSPKWKIDEAKQARYAVREYLANLALGVNLTIYYDYRDDGTDLNDQEHNFGLLHNDYSDKPASIAVRAMFEKLNGYTFVHRLTTKSPDDWRLLFRKGDSIVIASWNSSPDAAPDAATPRFEVVPAPVSRDLSRAASVEYPSGTIVGSPLNPIKQTFTITNRETAAAHIDFGVGKFKQSLDLASGKSKTFSVDLSSDTAMGVVTALPVSVQWNGVAVPSLPAVETLSVDLVSVRIDPTAKSFAVHLDTTAMAVKGVVEVDNGGMVASIPISLDSFSAKDISVPGDPAKLTFVRVVDSSKRVIAKTVAHRYALMPGIPQNATDKPAFEALPFVKNAATAPMAVTTVPAGDGAPFPFAMDMPYGTSLGWLYTELRPVPRGTIPDDADELIVWVKSTGDSTTANARYVDATDQWFQPTTGRFNPTTWTALRIPFRGIQYCWGGAGDGVQHLPLKWEAIINVDGPKKPEEIHHLLVGPVYYALTK
ncbi:MAG TPA: cellulase family glycosylhydrolase [Capsulimonadaceae bacterium]|jgi:hypothetical protein